MAQHVLVTGASGLVGTALLESLNKAGYQLSVLSRSKKSNSLYPTFTWDYANDQLEEGALDGIDTIVHLAGAGVADEKWSQDRKEVILESRTQTSRLLYDRLKEGNHQVKTFVAASAIGIYGNDKGNQRLTESSPVGHDFLAHVTDAWELSTRRIEELGIRVVHLRIGVVLSHKGGALVKLLEPPVAAGLGKGDQYMSWIHINDVVGITRQAIDDPEMKGPYNVVAPSPVGNKDLTRAAAKAFGKTFVPFNVPSKIIKVMLGEMASIVLTGSRVSAEKVMKAGYQFEFPKLEAALQDLASKPGGNS